MRGKRIGRLSSRRQSRAPALARQSRQRLRRYSFEHKKNFIEFTLHAGKAVFFSKERASLVCGDFSSWRLTWALLAEGPLYDVLFLLKDRKSVVQGNIDVVGHL